MLGFAEIKVLHPYELTSLSNRMVNAYERKAVLHPYELTSLSNITASEKIRAVVLHPYELTSLSNRCLWSSV